MSDEGRRGADGAAVRLGHQEVWELIPWYVNGTLESSERRALEEHVERCPLCRREVDANRELAAAVADAGEAAPAPGDRLRRVMARLDGRAARAAHPPRRPAAEGSGSAQGARRRLGWWSHTPVPARRALLGQLAALLVLAVALGWLVLRPVPPAAPAEPAFRTLSDPRPAPAAAEGPVTVRLLFTAGTSEAEIRRLLLAEGGRLVGGPTPTGVYTAAFALSDDPRGRGGSLLQRLRAAPVVELAEPVSRSESGVAP